MSSIGDMIKRLVSSGPKSDKELKEELARYELRRRMEEEIAERLRTTPLTTVMPDPFKPADSVTAEAMKEAIQKLATEFPAESKPSVQKIHRFKFVGKMSWAWEVENKIVNEDINELLRTEIKANELGVEMAMTLFENCAKRAKAGPANESYIDEEGANLILPNVPFSPYTDEGAAFFTSLAYNWRGLAEEWNALEEDRIKEAAARRDAEMALTHEAERQRLAEHMAKRADDKIDASVFMKKAKFYDEYVIRPEATPLITGGEVQPTGIDKIAAALARGELIKSKF